MESQRYHENLLKKGWKTIPKTRDECYAISMTKEQQEAQASIIASQIITTEELKKIVEQDLIKLLK